MSLDPVNDVWVGLRFDDETLPVGHLTLRTVAGRGAHEIIFEYDTGFIQRGIDISPLKCQLEPGWRSFKSAPFKGLPGVFADSLPDGWGHWLLDAELKQRGIDPSTLTPLDRLCHVGDCGMGALVYVPIRAEAPLSGAILVEELAAQSKRALSGQQCVRGRWDQRRRRIRKAAR